MTNEQIRLIEILLLISLIITPIVRYWIVPGLPVKSVFVFILLIWAIVAFMGVFIPSINEKSFFRIPNHGNKLTGFVFEINFKSKGGFIAGEKINVIANTVDIPENSEKIGDIKIDSKKNLEKNYSRVHIMFPHTYNEDVKPEKNTITPSGQITLFPSNENKEISIMYNSPGIYNLDVLVYYMSENNPEIHNLEKVITISPQENTISLKNYSVMYALTIITILIALLQTKFFE